jgi:hypothetical protein
MNKVISVMHDATHVVPGVPRHGDARPGIASSHQHDHIPHVHNHAERHQAPPQVLVAWQNWIGRLVPENQMSDQ